MPSFDEATAADDSHLRPCPHCAAMNGLSAAACWRCEADLSAPGGAESIAAPMAAPARAEVEPEAETEAVFHPAPLLHSEPVHSPQLDAWADSLQPVFDPHETSVQAAAPEAELRTDVESRLPALSASMPEGYLPIGQRLSEAEANRRKRRAIVAVAGVGLLVLAMSLVFREHFAEPNEPPLAPARAVQEIGVPPPSVEAAVIRPTQAELPTPVPAEVAAPKAPLRAEVGRVAAAAATPRVGAGTGTSRGTWRGAVRPTDTAAAASVVAAPAPRPEALPARPVAAAAGACTAAVAALGLCSPPPPSQPKE